MRESRKMHDSAISVRYFFRLVVLDQERIS